MKFTLPPLAGTLLLSYAVYTCFIPVSIAHSIILFSLAGLFGYKNYLDSIKTPSLQNMIAELRLEFKKQMDLDKEKYELKLQELKNEQSRQTLERANQSSAPLTNKKPPIKF